VQPEHLSPHAWLKCQPLKPSEQLFAVFSSASDAEPLKIWQRSVAAQAPSPIWAGTAYAEWKPVMPYVAIVAADSEFLDWVAATESDDWGWLAVSSVSLEVLVEHLRSLTQVLLPNGNPVFFRFWDGRHLLPVLRCGEVDSAELLTVIGRCLINGQPLDIEGGVETGAKAFPWWQVSESLLQKLGAEDAATRIGNLMQWLSEEQPSVFEAFSENVLRSKVANFLTQPNLAPVPKDEVLAYLLEEMQ
jgi:hypothetical protein